MNINVYSQSDVHEHRAPTDASVRLLKEMEEKAEEKFREGIHVKSSNFETKIYRTPLSYDFKDGLVAIAKINGKTIEARFMIDIMDLERKDKPKNIVLLEGIIEELGKEIAKTILIPAFVESKAFNYV